MSAAKSQAGNGLTTQELGQRLEKLERAVSELSRRIALRNDSEVDPKWYITQAGRFADDPVFDEIVRLGREYRESLRPGARKQNKKAGGSNARGRKAERART